MDLRPLRQERAEQARCQVTAVRSRRSRSRLLRPFVTAARRTEAVDHVIVEVELRRLTAGLPGPATRGRGSAAEALAVTGESAVDIIAAVEGALRDAVLGDEGTAAELSARIQQALPGAGSAKAALDVAVHDAWSRSLQLPLVEALGGSADGSMAEDMTISLEEPAEMARRATEAAARGTSVLKIKLGRDPAIDRRRLRAVVEAAPSATLRLDANQGWSAEEAIAIIGTLVAEGLPVELVEQPVAAADVDGLARVRASSSLPIMADESVWTEQDARRIIAAGAADMLNIKLAKCGGIRPALAIADAALEAGLPCMMGAMMEPRTSISAAAHLSFAHPAITMIDLDSPAWFEDDPGGGYRSEAGRLHLLDAPGTGMDIST